MFDTVFTTAMSPIPTHPGEISLKGLKIDDRSKWELGIKTIESLLRPGSATEKLLEPWQRDGLNSARELLSAVGSSEGKKNSYYIPKGILSDETSDSSAYLMAEFGGVKGGVHTPAKKHSLRAVAHAQMFSRSLRRSSIKNVFGPKAAFLPPEWSQLPSESRDKLRALLTWPSLSKWDFNVLELEKYSNGNPLLFLGWAVLSSPASQIAMALPSEKEEGTSALDGYGFLSSFGIRGDTVCNYIRAIEGDYRATNSYHSSTHAADVVQTLHVLIQRSEMKFGSSLDLFSILLAAVVHDVGHPGYNNAFQVRAKTALALNYNDHSVLENMHASKAFQLLSGCSEEDQKLKLLDALSPKQESEVRTLVIDAILQTDMTGHFQKVDKIKGILLSKKVDQIMKEHSKDVLTFLLHMADISNPAKPSPMFITWADRCLEEFFNQGDKEAELFFPISPLCNRSGTERSQSQIGFIQFVIKPAFVVLGKLIPFVDSDVLPIIDQNLEYWQKEKTLEDSE